MLIVRRDAEADIHAAYDWYERQRMGLGISFLAEIDKVLDKIESTPKLYSVVHKGIRRAICG